MYKIFVNMGGDIGWLYLIEAWDYETDPLCKLFKTRVEAREYAELYTFPEYKIVEENT